MDSGGGGEPAHRLEKLKKMIENCERSMTRGKEAQAFADLRKAQQQYNNDGEAQLVLGKTYTDFERDDEAIACFKKSIELEPNKNWDKFVCLAQLLSGADAVNNFERALKVLLEEHPEAVKTAPKRPTLDVFLNGNVSPFGQENDSESAKVNQTDVRDIYLSILENYLHDDMWSQPDSKAKCKELIDKLLAVVPNDFEALQAVASYYLRCADNEQATKYIKDSLSQWEPAYAALQERCKGFAESDEYISSATMFDLIPTYDFRTTTVTILVDLGMLEKAEEIGKNMYDLEKVRDYTFVTAMAVLYDKLKKKSQQKDMLVTAFAAGVLEDMFELDDGPAEENNQTGLEERNQLIAKYVEAGGIKEELLQKAEQKIEEADDNGSEDDDDEEDESDTENTNEDEDEDDMEE